MREKHTCLNQPWKDCNRCVYWIKSPYIFWDEQILSEREEDYQNKRKETYEKQILS